MLTLPKDAAIFDIYPKVVPVGREVCFTLLSNDPHLIETTPAHFLHTRSTVAPKSRLLPIFPLKSLRHRKTDFVFV